MLLVLYAGSVLVGGAFLAWSLAGPGLDATLRADLLQELYIPAGDQPTLDFAVRHMLEDVLDSVARLPVVPRVSLALLPLVPHVAILRWEVWKSQRITQLKFAEGRSSFFQELLKHDVLPGDRDSRIQ